MTPFKPPSEVHSLAAFRFALTVRSSLDGPLVQGTTLPHRFLWYEITCIVGPLFGIVKKYFDNLLLKINKNADKSKARGKKATGF